MRNLMLYKMQIQKKKNISRKKILHVQYEKSYKCK